MRTKALLGLAALAAGALTTMAQSNVYSLNIVGYVNVPINPGFNIIANPLDNGTNDLVSLFATPNRGDTVYEFVGGAFTSSSFVLGNWSTDLTVPPGIGIFYQSTAANPATNTFVGNVLTGNLTNNIAAGFSLVASQVPQSDTLENLNFPGARGDSVYYFRSGSYVSSTFVLGAWSPDLMPAVGEGFWADVPSGATWWRVFNP